MTGVFTADAGAATVMADAATSAPPTAAAYDLALILAPVLGEDAFALAHQVSPRRPLSVLERERELDRGDVAIQSETVSDSEDC